MFRDLKTEERDQLKIKDFIKIKNHLCEHLSK